LKTSAFYALNSVFLSRLKTGCIIAMAGIAVEVEDGGQANERLLAR
jgi:hypothetical protein